jgi:hypothetical protein
MMEMIKPINWASPQGLPSRSYRCGYCGNDVASEKGWVGHYQRSPSQNAFVYICHRCTGTTFFDIDNHQWPGVSFGNAVADIDDQGVAALYDEARGAFSASSYTATVLCCRKLLMHIAVAKKAPAGKNFVEYVQYLADHHYVPPDAKPWVDHIRTTGNEANHEIKISSRPEAEELISFCEMLLKIIFEFPAAVRNKVRPPAP